MPEVESVSAREPASIQTPTVAVEALGEASVATVRPFGSVEICVSGDGDETVVASDRVRRACSGGRAAVQGRESKGRGSDMVSLSTLELASLWPPVPAPGGDAREWPTESELPIGRCADCDGVPKEQERGLTGARTADRSKFLASMSSLSPGSMCVANSLGGWERSLASRWLPPPFSRSA